MAQPLQLSLTPRAATVAVEVDVEVEAAFEVNPR
jgi:hypothetical protein